MWRGDSVPFLLNPRAGEARRYPTALKLRWLYTACSTERDGIDTYPEHGVLRNRARLDNRSVTHPILVIGKHTLLNVVRQKMANVIGRERDSDNRFRRITPQSLINGFVNMPPNLR